jgi:hypothetical protein
MGQCTRTGLKTSENTSHSVSLRPWPEFPPAVWVLDDCLRLIEDLLCFRISFVKQRQEVTHCSRPGRELLEAVIHDLAEIHTVHEHFDVVDALRRVVSFSDERFLQLVALEASLGFFLAVVVSIELANKVYRARGRFGRQDLGSFLIRARRFRSGGHRVSWDKFFLLSVGPAKEFFFGPG